jgi:hypothetical protein
MSKELENLELETAIGFEGLPIRFIIILSKKVNDFKNKFSFLRKSTKWTKNTSRSHAHGVCYWMQYSN